MRCGKRAANHLGHLVEFQSNCQKKIPLARLNALPTTTLCINCEVELEKHTDWLNRRDADNWGKAYINHPLLLMQGSAGTN